MAHIRKLKSGKFIAEVQINKISKSKTFYNVLDAQQWAIDMERRRGKHKHIPHGKTLADTFKRYMDEVSPKHKGGHWEVLRIEKITRDYEICRIKLEELTAQDLQDWIDLRLEEVSPATVRREFNLFRSTLRVAKKRWKWIHAAKI